MIKSLTKASVGGAALIVTLALAMPGAASAQSYGYGPQPYSSSYGSSYDQDRYGRDYGQDVCRSDRSDRRTSGAVIGATVGAFAGSQLAARGRRTEGSVLGGLLGAAIGAGVGNDSARRCDDRGYAYQDDRYAPAPSYDGYGQSGYQDDRYRDDRYNNDRYDDRGYGQAYGYDDRAQTYGCRTVETRRQGRNGRVVVRSEQVCNDRY